MFGRLLAMHAPDGLYSLPVNIVFGLVVCALVTASCRTLSRRQDHRLVPLMGLLAAFVFAGQMVNFPIASGTTGHLLGGTLAAILVGPWAGTVIMAAVIVFQALLGDGGLTVLGPNIFNMGVVGTCLAYFIYRAFVGRAFEHPARVVAASFFAAWAAVPLASVFASLQLAVSGTASLSRALPAMVLTHMAIGIGEALITAGVVAFVLKTRPDLLYGRPDTESHPIDRRTLALGLVVSLFIATFLSLLPGFWDYPDGLEYVGLQQGFLVPEAHAAEDGARAVLAKQTTPGLGGLISTGVAGAIGTLVMFVVALQVGRVLMRPKVVRG
jgi:cobalt/nickel transport system permease protein